MLKTIEAFADALLDTLETLKCHAILLNNRKRDAGRILNANLRNHASTIDVSVHAIVVTTPTVMSQITSQCAHVNQAILETLNSDASNLVAKAILNVQTTRHATMVSVLIHVH